MLLALLRDHGRTRGHLEFENIIVDGGVEFFGSEGEHENGLVLAGDSEVGYGEVLGGGHADVFVGQFVGLSLGGDGVGGAFGFELEVAELFLEVEFAEEEGQGGAHVFGFLELHFLDAFGVGGVEPDVLAVGDEEFAHGGGVLPTHAAGFAEGEEAAFVLAGTALDGIGFRERYLEGFRVVIAILNAFEDTGEVVVGGQEGNGREGQAHRQAVHTDRDAIEAPVVQVDVGWAGGGVTMFSFMAQLLNGKTALILGIANRWSIAYAIAQAFVREGARVILTYQGERQKVTVEELGAEIGAALVMACDVSQDAELDALAAALKEGKIVLHAVVHSIAFANREDLSRPFVETSRAGFAMATEVSAYSLVAVARATAPLMASKEEGGGSIMTLTYLGSTRVVQNYNVMGVAKAALEAVVRYLANDLGPANIRVNAISAGAIKTASARGIKGFSKMLEMSSIAPLRRHTDPAEVADTAVFLASDLGRGVTANVLYVDAGFQVIGLAGVEG